MALLKSEILGMTFHRLTVVEAAGTKQWKSGTPQKLWRCICVCGGETVATTANLRSGNTKSCGCYQRDRVRQSNHKHGLSRRGSTEPAYTNWQAMIGRCYNGSGRKNYYKDVTVCDRWRFGENGKTAAECFIEDMGQRPFPKASIDRIDPFGNYEKSNCRWATTREQALNKRSKVAKVVRVSKPPVLDEAGGE